MSMYGWCSLCKVRVGEKKFRQILIDRCNDCIRAFGEPSLPKQPEPEPHTTDNFGRAFAPNEPGMKQKTDPPIREKKTSFRPTFVPKPNLEQKTSDFPVKRRKKIPVQPLDPEEEAMLAWLRSQPVMKAYWQRAAASELDWSILKIRRVAGRLRNRKIWKFSKAGLNDGKLILEALTIPKTTTQLAEELPFDKSWISEILRNLEKQGLVFAKKPFSKNQPYLYEIPAVKNTQYEDAK